MTIGRPNVSPDSEVREEASVPEFASFRVSSSGHRRLWINGQPSLAGNKFGDGRPSLRIEADFPRDQFGIQQPLARIKDSIRN